MLGWVRGVAIIVNVMVILILSQKIHMQQKSYWFYVLLFAEL